MYMGLLNRQSVRGQNLAAKVSHPQYADVDVVNCDIGFVIHPEKQSVSILLMCCSAVVPAVYVRICVYCHLLLACCGHPKRHHWSNCADYQQQQQPHLSRADWPLFTTEP